MSAEKDLSSSFPSSHVPQKQRALLALPDRPEDETFLSESTPLWEDAASLQAPSFDSCINADLEKEALEYVQSFMQSNEQDWSKRLGFIQRVDILSSATSIRTFHSSSLTVDVIKFLIPWTASKNAVEQERAIKNIVRLCKKLFLHSEHEEVLHNFPITGQLAGCFILCCSDHNQVVSHSASEGLHHLYNFIMYQKGQTAAKGGGVILMEWEREDDLFSDPTEMTLFSDPMEVTQVFTKHLRPVELTNFIVIAIRGMRDDSVHSTKAAIYMLRIILRDPNLALGKVSKAVISIHHNLDSISDPIARQETLRALRFLGKCYMNKVVNSLLMCSLECDSTAAEMWNALVRFSAWASKVLKNLLACLQGKPGDHDISAKEAILFPVAATEVLDKILQDPLPAFREELKEVWEKFSLVLIFWISHTFHLRMWEWETIKSHLEEDIADMSPLRLTRPAVSTLRKILQCASCENESMLMKKLTVWELLADVETYHRGVSFFARTIAHIPPRELKWMLEHIMVVLDNPDETCYITAMAFFVELLQCPDLSIVQDEDIIYRLTKQLSSSKAILRSLALEGILHLADNAKMVVKLQPFLPEILKRLQETNRETSLKALRLVKHLVHHLEESKCMPLALEIAAQVLPLFDDDSHKVRSLAVCLFGNLLENVMKQNKGPMKEHVIRSLVPLVMHLHDRSPIVSQACWDTLSTVAKFLSCNVLQPSIQSQDKWCICLLIVKHYRKDPASHVLSQSIKYLKSPQTSIREVAIRLIGLAAQETKSKRKLETICKVLNDVKEDSKPSVSCLATQTIQILETVHDQIPPGCSMQMLFYRMWRTCIR